MDRFSTFSKIHANRSCELFRNFQNLTQKMKERIPDITFRFFIKFKSPRLFELKESKINALKEELSKSGQ